MTRRSLSLSDYPQELQEAIFSLERRPGRTNCVGKEAIRRITDPVGQLLYVAHSDGLEVEFSFDAIAAYIRDLEHRAVKNTTRTTYMKGIRRLAVALNWECDLIEKIDAEIKFYTRESRLEVPEKERKLLSNPITLSDVSDAALHWFNIAKSTENRTKRRSNFQRAAFLALTSLVPIRLGDIQHLRVDQDIFRTRDVWFLSTTSRKTADEKDVALHANLTPYLDALIHHGESGRFENTLRNRSGTPLFCKPDGSLLLRETLWRHFKIGTGGHSPHIVRTLTHDFFAAENNPQSALTARILCGQKSLSVSPAYEVFAARARFQRGQKALASVQERALKAKTSGVAP